MQRLRQSGRLLVESMSHTLSAYLVQRYSDEGVRLKVTATVDKPLDGRRLSRVMDFVDAQISGDLAVSDMAKIACLSPAHFARSFKATTGRTPHEFVSGRRFDLARKIVVRGTSLDCRDRSRDRLFFTSQFRARLPQEDKHDTQSISRTDKSKLARNCIKRLLRNETRGDVFDYSGSAMRPASLDDRIPQTC
jgi:AraC family transcriptional regulator